MDFASIKSIEIPEGTSKGIAINGVPIWSGGGGGDEPEVLLSWEHVMWSIANNRYTTDYSIGDLIPLDLGTEGNINMQIAAFDADDLADGSGKAHISFVSKELLNTSHRMNPERSASGGQYIVGTGGVGGWEHCEIRPYLKDTIKPLIPLTVRSSIIEVTKSRRAGIPTSQYGSEIRTTTDDVWLPSSEEINGSTPLYGALFPDDASRIKCKVGDSEASKWWTSTASESSGFNCVYGTGKLYNGLAVNTYNICLGFCL